MFQILIVLSKLPLTIILLSYEKATEFTLVFNSYNYLVNINTQLVCPSRVLIKDQLLVFQILIALSSLPLAIILLSDEIATEFI